MAGQASKFELEVVRNRFEPPSALGWTYDGVEFLVNSGGSCGAQTPAAGSVAKATIVNNEFLMTHYEGVYLTPCLSMNPADAANSRMLVANNTFYPDPVNGGDLTNAVWYNALAGYGPDLIYANNLYLGPQSNPLRGVQPDIMAANIHTTISPFVNAAMLDMHLVAASAPIDAAGTMYAPPDDIQGKPRPVDGNGDMMSLPDVGAYEYVP